MTGSRPSFLIVNDDGVDSPMLQPMVDKLARLGEVRLAVPMEEQSWRGKSVTRFGEVRTERRDEFGIEAYAVWGTPSDCVNLAVHHLFGGKPDWIVSGINVGSNVGSGFIINSGTVGAALEGMIQGVPSVAFSTYMEPRLFMQWSVDKRFSDPEALRVVDATTTRMAEMMEAIIAAGVDLSTSILNINFPGLVDRSTPVRWVPPQVTRYGSLFKSNGNGSFVHAASVELFAEDNDATDREVVMKGEISVSELTMDALHIPAPKEIPF